ncbi:MAG: hypothetical protein INQ03_03220 [Candidatus Heimdallarchaeota archaeon]|nr:hypothetical protein [Candidatus Heimdallarchaeota archaeon]
MDSVELMEASFNIFYLSFIAIIAILMLIKRDHEKAKSTNYAHLLMWAFVLLGLGDFGHVGFRTLEIFGVIESETNLVGYGAFATATTVTFFYMLFLEAWRRFAQQEKDTKYWILQGVGILRLIIMMFPQNEWSSSVPPQEWGWLRNAPLTILGVSVAILYFKYSEPGTYARKSSYGVFASYAFYLPVILFVQIWPMVGMLMIPKTIAYMYVAWITRKEFYVN